MHLGDRGEGSTASPVIVQGPQCNTESLEAKEWRQQVLLQHREASIITGLVSEAALWPDLVAARQIAGVDAIALHTSTHVLHLLTHCTMMPTFSREPNGGNGTSNLFGPHRCRAVATLLWLPRPLDFRYVSNVPCRMNSKHSATNLRLRSKGWPQLCGHKQ